MIRYTPVTTLLLFMLCTVAANADLSAEASAGIGAVEAQADPSAEASACIRAVGAQAEPFLVVIASFTEQGDARRLAQAARDHYKDAAFTYDEDRKLYHVYIGQTDSHQNAEALRAAASLHDGFVNAWIYSDMKSFRNVREIIASTPEQYARLTYAGSSSASVAADQRLAISGESPLRTVTLAFRAKTTSGVSVPGKVMLLNRDANATASFKTGNAVALNRQGGQKVILSCDVKGYGPEIAFIDLSNISASENIRRLDDGTLEITFALGKIDANAVTLVYRNIFQKDASVFTPDTKDRLDLLSAIIKRNPYLHVEINAHCPEEGRRTLKLAAGDYFDISRATVRTGNERFLTSQRARAVRSYLIAHGTHRSISVMGWGAIAPLITAESAVSLSERVEVELTTYDR